MPKNEPTNPDEDRALAKFAVIAPLVCRDLSPDERELERKRILAATHQFPGGKQLRLSPRTLREWCQLYRKHSLAGLMPRPRKDKGKPRAISQATLDKALALKAELPSRSAERITDMIAAPDEKPVSASTLARHFQKAGLDRARDPDPKVFQCFEHRRPNDCWQSDLCDGILLPDPTDPTRKRRCYLHGFLDDHSRLVTHAAFYWRESLPALEDCFRQAITKHGIPATVYWDNGSVYRAQQLRRMAARLKVHVIYSTPYAPEGKGKIERFWATVQNAFFPEAVSAGIQTLDELNRFFWGWLDQQYQHKVHSSTGQTPVERWEARREYVRFATPENLADVFLWEEERVVRKTGTVALDGNEYHAPAHLVGQRVMLRFDPFDLREVKIVHQRLARPQETIPARTLPADDLDRLTAPALVAHVAAQLAPARELTPDDQEAIAAFWQRHAPLRAPAAVRALADAIAAKGKDRHISFYLEAIRQAHWGIRP